ncbi:MAG: hypothetical protein ABEJ07_04370 [Candidatus Nanohaloarchaea archaeon]
MRDVDLEKRLNGLQYLSHIGLEDCSDYEEELDSLETDIRLEYGSHWATQMSESLERGDYSTARDLAGFLEERDAKNSEGSFMKRAR